jgi:hypothetical protein
MVAVVSLWVRWFRGRGGGHDENGHDRCDGGDDDDGVAARP